MNSRALTVCRECGKRWMPADHSIRGITLTVGDCDVCRITDWVSPAYDYKWPREAYEKIADTAQPTDTTKERV